MALGAVRYEIVAWLAQLGERRFADREVAGPAGHQYSRSLNTVTIPKISHGAYIFQRPFLGGLVLERLIFGGAYLRGEIGFSKPIGPAHCWFSVSRHSK